MTSTSKDGERRSRFQTEFGAALSRELAHHRMTAAELAAETSVTPGYVSHVATGRKRASAQWIELVGRSLGLSRRQVTALHDASVLDLSKK